MKLSDLNKLKTKKEIREAIAQLKKDMVWQVDRASQEAKKQRIEAEIGEQIKLLKKKLK